MKKQRILMTLTYVLACLTLFMLLFAHLALTDIFHNNESDLQMEWWAVRLTFGVIVMFVISVFATLKTISPARHTSLSAQK